MKTLYLECNMGAAGDMLMAALYELLEDKQGFLDTMNSLGLPGVRLEAQAASTCGIAGTHIAVTVHGQEETEPAAPEAAGQAHFHRHGEEHHHHEHEHGHEHSHEHHHHHHGHDADEVFSSWGAETARQFSEEEIDSALHALDSLTYGQVVRAKGYVPADGGWIYFDYVPGEREIRRGAAAVTGRICVIGAHLDEDGLKELFNLA